MEKDNRNAYSEVIEILKLIDDEKKLEVLPMEMLEILKSKANPDYKPQISSEIPLDEQNLQPETLSILSWIAMKYWGNEIENKTNEENIVQDVNQKIEYNTNTEEINQQPYTPEQQNVNLPILHKDLKWYQKIKAKILDFFHKIFKKAHNENKIDEK